MLRSNSLYMAVPLSNITPKFDHWLALALLSLLAANILAIFLILLKIPVFSFTGAQPLFKTILSYHVNLAMVFWMPLVATWLWNQTFSHSLLVYRSSLSLSIIAILLFIFSLIDMNNSVELSNYYPILHSELFICALVIQVLAVSIVVISVIKHGEMVTREHFCQNLPLMPGCY